ncbi:uncharacterized protein LOC107471322 [Arachis duranensis]|uniref:Uncharacterized protein LOC107471322 n=1 Tax=Arachis duranensis TaxID=130453 RepID=A0A6P4BUP0_ARADU|nr:uncharacterized protein LOC107471322 [Arachis duranensis]
MSFTEFQNTIIQKLGMQRVKRVEKLFYRILIFVLRDDVKYDSFVIGSDEDLQVLFHCRRQFSKVRSPKILAKFIDVVYNSGGLNQNPQPSAMVACSSSMSVGISSSVPVIVLEAVLVATSSLADDLNRNRDREIDVLQDDDDDYLELAMIADDSDDDIVRSNPAGGGGAASSETQHFHQRRGIWEVKRYNRPHTCLTTSISSDHRMLDYHVISTFILPKIRVDAAVSIKVLLNATEAHFSFRPTYKRIWLAKQKVGAQIYGD